MLLEGWRTPQPEHPKDMADIAIKRLYFDFDPEDPEKDDEDVDEDNEATMLYAIASLEDLCGSREKYMAATQTGRYGSQALRKKLLMQFEKYFSIDTPCCPCKHCHKELREPGWEPVEFCDAHDGCSLM